MKRKIRILLCRIFSVGAVLVLFPILFSVMQPPMRYEVTTLLNGWTVEEDEESRQNVDSKDVIQGVFGNGEAIVLMRELPDSQIPTACLKITLKDVSLRVYISGESVPIYHFADSSAADASGRVTHYILLPGDYAGRTITIMMTGARGCHMLELSEITLGNRTDLFYQWLHAAAYALMYGSYLVVFSLILLCAFLMLVRTKGHFINLLLQALISFAAGVHIIFLAGYGDFLMPGTRIDRYALPASLILLFVSMIALIVVRRHDLLRLIGRGGTDRAQLNDRKTLLVDLLPVISPVFLALCVLADHMFFSFSKSTFHFSFVGALLYASILLNDFYSYAAEHAGTIKRNAKLNNVAYTDPLTGNSNRAYCEQVMRELDREGAQYSIIMMDVNGLKKVNDTMGHAAGDRFLKEFGQILSVFYKNALLVSRMGGDEFVIILKDKTLEQATERAEAFETALHRINRNDAEFQYRAAYGVAHVSEVKGRKASDVYKLADERMYKRKEGAYTSVLKTEKRREE